MGRGKLSMELISNEKSRMITYQKRKNGLLKKAEELSILCDIQTCVIIFGPKLSNYKDQLTELVTFPKDHNRVASIINKFKGKPLSNSDNVPTRRRSSNNLSDFFAARKKKIDDEVARLRKENLESKYPSWDDSLNGLSIEQLRAVAERLEPKLDAAKMKIRVMGKMKTEQHRVQVVGDWAEHSLFGSTSQISHNNGCNIDYLHLDPQGYNYNQFQPETQQFPAHYYPPNQTLPMFLFGLNPPISIPTQKNDEYGQSQAWNNNNMSAIEQKVSAWNKAAALESGVLYNPIPRTSLWSSNIQQQQQPLMMPHQQYQYSGQQLVIPQPAAANGYGSPLNGSVPEFYEYFGDNKMPKS